MLVQDRWQTGRHLDSWWQSSMLLVVCCILTLYLKNMFSNFFLPFCNEGDSLLSPVDFQVDQILTCSMHGYAILSLKASKCHPTVPLVSLVTSVFPFGWLFYCDVWKEVSFLLRIPALSRFILLDAIM